MRRIARLFPLLVAAPLYLHAQPADPGGWSNIKWGMTLKDVRVLYPAATEADNQYWTGLTLPAIKINGVPFAVDASAKRPSDRISLISLGCMFGIIPAPPPQTSCSGPEDFEILKNLLLEKYGREKNEERTLEFGDPVHLFLWAFPTTSIQLKIRQLAGTPRLGYLRIEYRPIDPQAAGVL